LGVPNNRGVRLEQSVAGWAEEVQSRLAIAFDYARQDTLARFDQFRGVWSRGPYEDRSDRLADFFTDNARRVGSLQKVKPSGKYFLNLARYDEYTLSPPHEDDTYGHPQHYVGEVSDWYYMRFRHEYVWYNDRHFPVDELGRNKYYLFRTEYVQPSTYSFLIGYEDTPYRAATYYDGGAWTGWKDDITSANWTTTPYLRWRENWGKEYINFWAGLASFWPMYYYSAGTIDHPFAAGGLAAGSSPYLDTWMGANFYYEKTNLFDSGNSRKGFLRLAVGPELTESREIYMNLTLPTNLAS